MAFIEHTQPKSTIKTYKHLFFDLDRTLWDFEKNANVALTEIHSRFSKVGYIGDYERFSIVYHYVNEGLWDKYRRGVISKEQLIEDRFHLTFNEFGFNNKKVALEAGEMYLDLSPRQTGMFPDALEVVEALSKKYKIHILTNGFKEVQTIKLKNCGLEPFISQLITSEDAGCQKPDERIFQYAVKQVGASPDEVLMIGDDLIADIAGAQNAGIDYVWFNPDDRDSKIDRSRQIKFLNELLSRL